MRAKIQWWFRKTFTRRACAIVISHSGQLTNRPMAHVSLHYRHGTGFGTLSVYAFELADAGDAKCTMYAQDLADATGFRVVDERERKS